VGGIRVPFWIEDEVPVFPMFGGSGDEDPLLVKRHPKEGRESGAGKRLKGVKPLFPTFYLLGATFQKQLGPLKYNLEGVKNPGISLRALSKGEKRGGG